MLDMGKPQWKYEESIRLYSQQQEVSSRIVKSSQKWESEVTTEWLEPKFT